MADNTQVVTGTGDTFRSKDRAGVKTEIVGLDLNPAGAEILQSASALADGVANPTIPAWAACGLVYNGATWDRVRGDVANGLDVDVTRVQGSVTVAQATAANLKVDASGAAVPVTDNGGSLTVDAPVGTPLRVDPTGTTTQPVSIASIPTVVEKQDQVAAVSATWTSATGANTTLAAATTGYGTASVTITTPSTATAGAITIEVSDDGGTTWFPAGAVRIDNTLAENVVALAGPGIAQSRAYAVSVDAFTHVRARLSTAITGAGNTVVRIATVAGGIEPLVSAIPPRTPFTLTILSVTTATAEALVNAVAVRGLTAAAAASSQTVTPGKTLRIMSITAAIITTAAAINHGLINLRARASGALAITDAPIWRARVGTNSAVQNSVGSVAQNFPDGIDLPSGTVFGFSGVAGAATGGWDVTLTGYEF